MAWFRRNKTSPAATAVTVEVVTPDPPSTDIAMRTERALVALAVHSAQLAERVERLETQINTLADRQLEAPANDDILDVRVHSAKVAAELARLEVNLRCQIDDLREKVAERDERVANLTETIIDLADGIDTRAADLKAPPGPWARTA